MQKSFSSLNLLANFSTEEGDRFDDDISTNNLINDNGVQEASGGQASFSHQNSSNNSNEEILIFLKNFDLQTLHKKNSKKLRSRDKKRSGSSNNTIHRDDFPIRGQRRHQIYSNDEEERRNPAKFGSDRANSNSNKNNGNNNHNNNSSTSFFLMKKSKSQSHLATSKSETEEDDEVDVEKDYFVAKMNKKRAGRGQDSSEETTIQIQITDQDQNRIQEQQHSQAIIDETNPESCLISHNYNHQEGSRDAQVLLQVPSFTSQVHSDDQINSTSIISSSNDNSLPLIEPSPSLPSEKKINEENQMPEIKKKKLGWILMILYSLPYLPFSFISGYVGIYSIAFYTS